MADEAGKKSRNREKTDGSSGEAPAKGAEYVKTDIKKDVKEDIKETVKEDLKRGEDADLQGVSPDYLFYPYPYSPVDNFEQYKSSIPWRSRIVGGWIRNLLQWKNILREVAANPMMFGPLSGAARLQQQMLESTLTDPIYRHAKSATRAGITPDTYVEHDENIENAYGDALHALCSLCMKRVCSAESGSEKREEHGQDTVAEGCFTFDDSRMHILARSPEGVETLQRYIRDFAALEWQYNCLGLTRLKAMKELLLSLIVVITGQIFKKRDMPFLPKGGIRDLQEYIRMARTRLENIYNNGAFNIRLFSEAATGGRIGYSAFDIVEGSHMHTVTLRRYHLPEGVPSNGRIIYMVSPLINRAEIFDLAKGKSVIEGMLNDGYQVYLQAPGDPGVPDSDLGLDFYGKTVHDAYLDIIKRLHPDQEIYIMGYCMGGTLVMPYLARRAEERLKKGKKMDITKVALMATPVKFDDGPSGHGPMRKVIRDDYDEVLMKEMYGEVNVPPQIISVGMNEIQQGVQYNVASGFYNRASYPGAVADAAPFLYWLTHGTRFGSRAHREWIRLIFMENRIFRGEYRLSSTDPELDGKAVDMSALERAGVRIFDYRGERDPISPTGSCVSSEVWGMVRSSNISTTRGGLNRTIEKNVGHIFVVSSVLLAEYLDTVKQFYSNEV